MGERSVVKMDEKVEKCYGRPAGRRKTAKIEIAIEPEIKDLYMEFKN